MLKRIKHFYSERQNNSGKKFVTARNFLILNYLTNMVLYFRPFYQYKERNMNIHYGILPSSPNNVGY